MSVAQRYDDGRRAKRPVVVLQMDRYHPMMHRGIARAASELGWVLDDEQVLPAGRRSCPGSATPDGAMGTTASESGLHWLQQVGCPAVRLLSNSSPARHALPDDIATVSLDFAAVGREAAEHLLSLRLPHVVYYRHLDGEDAEELMHSFLQACRAAGAEPELWDVRQDHPPCGEERNGPDRRLKRDWLKRKLEAVPLPCAVMAEDDREAHLLIAVALDVGLRVPEDVAVLGCENRWACSDSSGVAISTFDMNFEFAGYAAARLLDRAMKGAQIGSVRVPPNRLIERESTATFLCRIPAVTAVTLRIRRKYREPFSVTAFARSFGVSERTLQRQYRAIHGRTIREDLMRSRLQAALHLLKETDWPLEPIAMESGLGCASNLCRLLKERHGVTPLQWRARAAPEEEREPKQAPEVPVPEARAAMPSS